jgi:hypothetical protein
MQHPVWREDGSVVYNCCWSSSAPLFPGLSHAGLMATVYCLRFDSPKTWRARSPYLYSPRTGCPNFTSRHCVPFSSPPTTLKTTVELFHPASTRVSTTKWSQSYVTTDGQSASLSWCQAPIWDLDQIFISAWHFRVCWCGAPSLTRWRGYLLHCTMYNMFTFYMLLHKCI